MKKIALLICLPLTSFAINVAADAVDTVDVVGERTNIDQGLVAASQAGAVQTSGGNRGGMSQADYAQMAAANCAAVAEITKEADTFNKECTQKADSWQVTQEKFCQGLSSSSTTNTIGGNVKVINGSSTNTTNSGISPDVCITQMNVTYGIKMTSCQATTASIQKRAEILKDAYCKK